MSSAASEIEAGQRRPGSVGEAGIGGGGSGGRGGAGVRSREP
jgi:hypothetical protein